MMLLCSYASMTFVPVGRSPGIIQLVSPLPHSELLLPAVSSFRDSLL